MTFIPRPVLIVVLVLTFAGAPARAEIIDRVLAVVNGAVITQSDLEGLLRFGLVRGAATERRAVLDRLIERRLMLLEVNRYSPPEPAEGLIAARLDTIRARFSSEEEFNRALQEVGLSRESLRGYVRDNLRILAYLRQRFGAALQPSEADVLQYYRGHPREFTRDGVLLSFSEAYDDARAALIVERRESLIGDWLSNLRRRADITVPAIVGVSRP